MSYSRILAAISGLELTFSIIFSVNSLNAQTIAAGQDARMAGQATDYSVSKETGLLFYLSGEKGYKADFASGGQVSPNFLKNVAIIQDGARGKAFKCDDDQLMAYWAPGNIYAQRGTLSFYWRSRYPVGPSPFPVFRVGYADHSSWDMTWLRIDYNGSGFDAFVTDIGLSRTRISYFIDKFPGPHEWTHIALSWDETRGIKFYVNGELVKEQSVTGSLFDTGLDQFGPHSRIISPYQVQSAYSFTRGGDVDEIRIYDHMLTDQNVRTLSEGKSLEQIPGFSRNLSERRWRDEWWTLNGWNLPNNPPPILPGPSTTIRKVEIHDAYDIKRWYWKANDGIRETTWPGVYNMSRLPGRYDYFVLPDWDCYSGSGQTVRFTLSDEPWNQVEMWGTAWGQLTYENPGCLDSTFSVRSRASLKSYVRLPQSHTGGKIRFDNALIEEPIGSFDVFNVQNGEAPRGSFSESFNLVPFDGGSRNNGIKEVVAFVRGRYPSDETAMMAGVPEGGTGQSETGVETKSYYPFLHIIIPYSGKTDSGLDGVEIQLPQMNVRPTHNGLFPVNIRIKDPLWQMRDLADFSFSVKPGDSPKLWIDTRDRILPEGRALYITIAGAGSDLTPELFSGAKVRLVYKNRNEALTEHTADRITQVRDLYAHIVEEHPSSSRLNLYNRFMADCSDLLSVDPGNWLARSYFYAQTGGNKPGYALPECPAGVPEWAFYQTEYLKKLANIVNYYIDNRQISNGEFGGGLSDDGDLTNMWPAMAFLGIEPDKLLSSLRLHMEAYYDPERSPENNSLKQRSLPLLTNGLATIFTDELHALEDGMQVVGQMMLLDYGSPKYVERGMQTSRRMLDDVTQINAEGHRHFRTRYYGATRMATEDPWQWSVNHSYHVLQTSYLLARYNGNPHVVKMITELADGLLAHEKNGKLMTEINFETDSTRGDTGNLFKPASLFYAAWYLTGDSKYLEPLPQRDLNHREFNKQKLSDSYKDEIVNLGVREYINTEGSIWIDRVTQFNPKIQEDRLGGTAIQRVNVLYPQNFVSWKFLPPANYASTAIFVPDATRDKVKVIAYNLTENPVNAEMTLWDIKPGKWRIRQGIDTNDDQNIDGNPAESVISLERGESITVRLDARNYTVITLELAEPSAKGYWDLPDLGIGPGDVRISGNQVIVKVHNIGAVASAETLMVIKDAHGHVAASSTIPSIEAPLDLRPKWKDITVTISGNADISHGSVEIDPQAKTGQITRRNKTVSW